MEVSFDIDANGILNVTAKDKATGREQNITITNSSGLSEDEVEKLVQEAAANEADDQARRNIIENRNQLVICLPNRKGAVGKQGKTSRLRSGECRDRNLRGQERGFRCRCNQGCIRSVDRCQSQAGQGAYQGTDGAAAGGQHPVPILQMVHRMTMAVTM